MYARYWLHGKGPAPAGNLPVAVHISPQLSGLRLSGPGGGDGPGQRATPQVSGEGPGRRRRGGRRGEARRRCGSRWRAVPSRPLGTLRLLVPPELTADFSDPGAGTASAAAYDLPARGYAGWDVTVRARRGTSGGAVRPRGPDLRRPRPGDRGHGRGAGRRPGRARPVPAAGRAAADDRGGRGGDGGRTRPDRADAGAAARPRRHRGAGRRAGQRDWRRRYAAKRSWCRRSAAGNRWLPGRRVSGSARVAARRSGSAPGSRPRPGPAPSGGRWSRSCTSAGAGTPRRCR